MMDELKADNTFVFGEECLAYKKKDADKMIEKIIEGAISMFRLSERCRGIDLKSPLGRIADAAFKHWCFVESIQNKNQQLKKDKDKLLQNNHNLHSDIERLEAELATLK